RRLRDRWLLRRYLRSLFLRPLFLRRILLRISILPTSSLLFGWIWAIWQLSRLSNLSASGLSRDLELSWGSVLSRCPVSRCPVSRRAGARAARPRITAATHRHRPQEVRDHGFPHRELRADQQHARRGAGVTPRVDRLVMPASVRFRCVHG